ncbi:hypothetical protein CORC01_09142 [Colletotrichum orchidophilum]|uniref:Uncharacterized protein n=1 Tax=Colletotrichum orchidophilum TaxID=1209926 RepID=A0A1G4B2M2_9PEZI|nr:hypothetical protein CORC01_09142 [Colletotrichum orchidophilum]
MEAGQPVSTPPFKSLPRELCHRRPM